MTNPLGTLSACKLDQAKQPSPLSELQPKDCHLPVPLFCWISKTTPSYLLRHIRSVSYIFPCFASSPYPSHRIFTDKTPYRRPSAAHIHSLQQTNMAEAQQIPTFKLVLVGDGGTGKVTLESIRMRFLQLWQLIQ